MKSLGKFLLKCFLSLEDSIVSSIRPQRSCEIELDMIWVNITCIQLSSTCRWKDIDFLLTSVDERMCWFVFVIQMYIILLFVGILAKKAVEAGLSVKPYIKTSLSPGSGVVTYYLQDSGVIPYLEKLG